MPSKVELIGGSFQDSEGNLLSGGYLTFVLSQDENVNGSQICAGIEVTVNLDGYGAIIAGQFIWGNDQMLPVNSYYTVTGYASNGQQSWGPNNQQVFGSGGTFDVGTWIPNQVISWIGGGGGGGSSIVLQTNNVSNSSQSTLNLVSGFGTLLVNSGGTTTVNGMPDVFFPENYGAIGNGVHDDTAAIQAAIAAAQANLGGIIQFSNKTYLTSASLIITASNICLSGITMGCTTISCTSASADILQITGTGAFNSGTNLFYNKISDMRFLRSVQPTGTATGVHFSLVNGTKLYRVECWDNIYGFWQDTTNAFIHYQQCQVAWSPTTTTGTVYGWYLNGGNIGFYSSRLLDCFVIGSAGGTPTTSYGMYITGAYVADLFCEGFETTTCTYGVYINGTPAGGGLTYYNNDDIHFMRCAHDILGNAAYTILNLNGGNSFVNIIGGYVSVQNGNTNSLINVTNSNGVLISGLNFRCTNGVYLHGTTTQASVKDCVFYCVGTNSGSMVIVDTGVNGNIVSNNRIYGYNGFAFVNGIYVNGSYNIIDGNVISGYSSANGIFLDASSSNNKGDNIATLTSGTGLVDSGTLNTVTV